jgi:hypothetical protein
MHSDFLFTYLFSLLLFVFSSTTIRMDKEKREADIEALPTVQGPNNTVQRRRSAILPRRVIFGVLGTFALWTLFNGIDTSYGPRESSPSIHSAHGECHSAAQSYMDRLTGGGKSVYATSYQGKHEGKHHDKDGHHDKHDHKHGDHHKHDPPHGHPHDPHHPPHDPHHPPHGPPHGPHHGPGHEHGAPKWISPKEAEDIFLSVPNNGSIRA